MALSPFSQLMVNLCKKLNLPDELVSRTSDSIYQFETADADKNWFLSKEECQKKLPGIYLMLEPVFKESSSITIQQYVKSILFQGTKNHWETVFKAVDADKSGFVEEPEMKVFLGKLGLQETDANKAAEKIKAYDADKNGKLSFNEFDKYLNDLLDRQIELTVKPETLNATEPVDEEDWGDMGDFW